MITYLSLPSPAGRTIVVGDVHGCWDELAQLLDTVSFGADDLLLCVGDIVDRGPDTWRVARFFRETPNAHTALGNHERRLARFVRKEGSAAWSQRHALSQLPRQEHADWAEWLLARPAVIATPDVVVAHARLDAACALDSQDPFHTCAVGGNRVWIEQDDKGVPCWFHAWGDPRPVCVGHIQYPRVELVPRRLFAVDTGCCSGNQLTAVVLPSCQVMSVDAEANHTRASQLAWEVGRYDGLEAWPVTRLLVLIADTEFQDRQPEVVERARVALATVDLQAALTAARPQLLDRWGEPPAGGAERGEYFRRIGEGYEHSLVGQLVKLAVTGREVQWSWMRQYLGERTLTDLQGILHSLGDLPPDEEQ